MRRLQLAGHSPIFLVGGATGMIGDPSGKTQERVLLTRETIEKNSLGMRAVVSRFLSFEPSPGIRPARFMNNGDWIGALSCIEFLRDVGKHFSVNMMLAKESVKGRIESREHGISYTEFSYMILQSYDFYHLHRAEGCVLQVGGSDQWGNITAGIDLIRRMHAADPTQGESEPAAAYGMTWPLVKKADGTKFGKSEAGNIWLDASRTSPYQFYQYLLQTPDADVARFLRYFSFRPRSEIEALEELVRTQPEKREAQRALARELTALVHGEDELRSVERATEALFGDELRSLSAAELRDVFREAPLTRKPRTALSDGVALIDLLVEAGLCTSKGAARKEIQGGGIYVNNQRVGDPNARLTGDDALNDAITVLRRGKKSYHLVVWE
jgi:tyrosyl-tRNA synthetase